MKLIIPEKLPSLNDFIKANRAPCITSRRRGKSVYSARFNCGNEMKQSVQEKIKWYILASNLVPVNKKVVMRYHWYEPDRMRDKSNICGFARKAIEDALVNEKILEGDGWKHIESFHDYFYIDKTHPRVEVEIEEVGL